MKCFTHLVDAEMLLLFLILLMLQGGYMGAMWWLGYHRGRRDKLLGVLADERLCPYREAGPGREQPGGPPVQ